MLAARPGAGGIGFDITLAALGCADAAAWMWSRRTATASKTAAILIYGFVSVAIIALCLSVTPPVVSMRAPLALIAFLAIMLTLDPAQARWALAPVLLADLGGAALLWWSWGSLASATDGLVFAGICALLCGAAFTAYANWGYLELHSRRQTIRLRAVANAARRIGLATDAHAVAEAVLSACRDTYPEVTFAAVLVVDAQSHQLRSLPVYLTPDGLVRAGMAADGSVYRGEGVSGRVISTGQSQLRRTAAEIAADYVHLDEQRTRRLEQLGGGRHAQSFVAAPLRNAGGEIVGVLSLNSHVRPRVWDEEDVTVVEGIADEAATALERVRLFDEQRRQAGIDPLTGQRNRRDFDRILSEWGGGHLALLAIDVDNLKRLNDEYGHEAGDSVLITVANVLAAHVRSNDTLARVGGDEFCVILPDTNLRTARVVADRMRRSLHGVSVAHGPVRISVGVAAGTDAVAAWRDADAALVSAKRMGRDRVAGVGTSSPRRLGMTHMLSEVLDGHRGVQPLFQPIVQMSSGQTVGVEALARFAGSAHHSVEDVFTAAHAQHRLRDLDWLCRRAAVAEAAALPPAMPLFLNVSAALLLDPVHPVDQMLLLLRWAGHSPTRIVLEITERETIHDMRRLRYVLASYREQGFRFALDDVGEGHSTLEVLAAATPEFVKLAGSLVLSFELPGPHAAIEAATAFGRASRAMVIAEGVENAVIAERVQAMGIDLVQGWHFGLPVQARELTDASLMAAV